MYSNFDETEKSNEYEDSENFLDDPFHETVEDIDDDDVPEIPDLEE